MGRWTTSRSQPNLLRLTEAEHLASVAGRRERLIEFRMARLIVTTNEMMAAIR